MRQLRTAAVAVTLASAVLTAPVVLAIPAGAAPSCAPVQVLGFRGSGEGPVDDGGLSNGWSGGALEGALTAARAAGMTAPVDGIDYPAVSPDAFVAQPALLTSSVAAGVADGLQAIADVTASCSGRTRFVLAGFSQGMIVAHELALAAPAGTVAGVFGYGDPDQMPGGAGEHGDTTGSGMYRELTAVGSTHPSDAFYALPLAVWTLCHTGDPVCDFSMAAALAGDYSQHAYGTTPQEQALLGAGLLSVITAVTPGAPASGGDAVTATRTPPLPSAPVPSLPSRSLVTPRLTLHRPAAGMVRGTVTGARFPDGTTVVAQGRPDAHHPWRTLARARVRQGAFSLSWRAGSGSRQVRVVLSAARGWRGAVVPAPPTPRNR